MLFQENLGKILYYFLNKGFYKNLNLFLSLSFPAIEIDGRHNTLNLYQPSIFSWCEPVQIIKKFKPFLICYSECAKVVSILNKLVCISRVENQIIKFEQISGLANASDLNWRSLKEYSESLLPRNRWEKVHNNSSFYGFETDEDFFWLENQLILGSTPCILSINYYTWNERYYILNTDGSHRCAAFYRQNYEQNRKYKFNATLYVHTLNKELLNSFLEEYYCIITSYYAASRIRHFFPFLDILSCIMENDAQMMTLIIKKKNTAKEKFLFNILRKIDLKYLFVLNESEYLKILK